MRIIFYFSDYQSGELKRILKNKADIQDAHQMILGSNTLFTGSDGMRTYEIPEYSYGVVTLSDETYTVKIDNESMIEKHGSSKSFAREYMLGKIGNYLSSLQIPKSELTYNYHMKMLEYNGAPVSVQLLDTTDLSSTDYKEIESYGLANVNLEYTDASSEFAVYYTSAVEPLQTFVTIRHGHTTNSSEHLENKVFSSPKSLYGYLESVGSYKNLQDYVVDFQTVNWVNMYIYNGSTPVADMGMELPQQNAYFTPTTTDGGFDNQLKQRMIQVMRHIIGKEDFELKKGNLHMLGKRLFSKCTVYIEDAVTLKMYTVEDIYSEREFTLTEYSDMDTSHESTLVERYLSYTPIDCR